MKKSFVQKFGVAVAVAVTTVGANAAMDTSSVTGPLSDGAVAGGVVAAAAILIPLGIKVFKYLRSAF